MCDQVSDAILDAHLKQDPDAKVKNMRKNLHPLGEKKSCPDAKIKHYDTHFVTQKQMLFQYLFPRLPARP